MFFKFPLTHDFDYYAEKIDTHIKEDFETKIPDYGAQAFNPIGFHFKRKGNKIGGIYRSKNASVGGNAFVSQSTHMHFKASMSLDKNGNRKMTVIMWPQLSQMIFILISVIFPLLLVKNFMETYIYVVLFAIMFLYAMFETTKLHKIVKTEFLKFFK